MEKVKYEAPKATDLSALGVRGDIKANCNPGFFAQDPGTCTQGGAPDAGTCGAGAFDLDANLCTSGNTANRDCLIGGAASNPVCSSGSAL